MHLRQLRQQASSNEAIKKIIPTIFSKNSGDNFLPLA
jgi:hypothetical protein